MKCHGKSWHFGFSCVRDRCAFSHLRWLFCSFLSCPCHCFHMQNASETFRVENEKGFDWQPCQPHGDSLCSGWTACPRQAVAGQKTPTDWRMSINCHYYIKEKYSPVLHRDHLAGCRRLHAKWVTDGVLFGCWLNFGFSILNLSVFSYFSCQQYKQFKDNTCIIQFPRPSRYFSHLTIILFYYLPSSRLGFNSTDLSIQEEAEMVLNVTWAWFKSLLQKRMCDPNSPRTHLG